MMPARVPRRAVRRVIVVVTDGVRPDVIPLLDLPAFGRLARTGAATMHGRTVRPSVTAAAMTSLLTGVAPDVHGMTTDQFRIPRPRGPIEPLPMVLRRAGLRSTAWMARVPWTYRRLAAAIVRRVGFNAASFDGDDAYGVLAAARKELEQDREGLMVLHWPDADRAGHESGWPSPPYVRAVRRLDRCLGELDAISGASTDPETLLIVLADHGGGGRRRKYHDSEHQLDCTIPIILASGRVVRQELPVGASLLDVPATVLDALGVPIPSSYPGVPLVRLRDRRPLVRPIPWPQFDVPLAEAV